MPYQFQNQKRISRPHKIQIATNIRQFPSILFTDVWSPGASLEFLDVLFRRLSYFLSSFCSFLTSCSLLWSSFSSSFSLFSFASSTTSPAIFNAQSYRVAGTTAQEPVIQKSTVCTRRVSSIFYPLFWKSRIFVQKCYPFPCFLYPRLAKKSSPFSEVL